MARNPSSQSRLAAGVALLAAVASVNTFRNGFVWDDQELIVSNDSVKSAAALGRSLTRDFLAHQSDGLAYGYYRPVTTVSYAADYSAWRLRPAGYHATNIILHAACACLGTLLLLRLGLTPGAATVAGVVFAVHPIHVESVAWISGRTDHLSVLLSLISFLAFLRARSTNSVKAHAARIEVNGRAGRKYLMFRQRPPWNSRPASSKAQPAGNSKSQASVVRALSRASSAAAGTARIAS